MRGKDALRAYWGKALALLPELHFSLIDLFVSPDSVVVFYENERGKQICEYLRVNAGGDDRAGVGEPFGAVTLAASCDDAPSPTAVIPREAGNPVRRGLSAITARPLEYWIARSSRAMTARVRHECASNTQ